MDPVGFNIELFLLCLMRVSGFVFAAPVLGSKFIPAMVRVWFAALLALAIMPVVGNGAGLPDLVSLNYIMLVAGELLIGIMIGFISSLFLQGVEFAGHVAGLQMGFASSTLFDPLSETDLSVVGRFQGMLAIVMFLGINGHHTMLSGFVSSYRIVPPVSCHLGDGTGQFIVATGGVFVIAVQIAMPVMSAIFMVEVGLALLAKAVPQMNIFVVGFPIRIAVGLAVLAMSMPYFTRILARAILGAGLDVRSVLTAIGGG